MYLVFFLIAGIAFIEIIFYFYYIGPMETKIFKNSINNVVIPLENSGENQLQPIKIQSPYNVSEFIIIDKNYENTLSQDYENKKEKGEKERIKKNHKLFIKTINYWIFFFIFCFITFAIEKRKHLYKCIKRKLSNDGDIEMIEMTYNNEVGHHPITFNTSSDDYTQDKEIKENKLCNIKKKDIIEYTFFCGGLLLFEYLFFQYIILKYDIISNSELKYSIFKNIFPLLHNFISISQNN